MMTETLMVKFQHPEENMVYYRKEMDHVSRRGGISLDLKYVKASKSEKL